MSKQMETRKRRNINFQYVLIISAMHFYFKMSFFCIQQNAQKTITCCLNSNFKNDVQVRCYQPLLSFSQTIHSSQCLVKMVFSGRRGQMHSTLPVKGQRLLQQVDNNCIHVKTGNLGDSFQHKLETFLLLSEDWHVMVSCAQDLQELRRNFKLSLSLDTNGTRKVPFTLWWVVDELPIMLKTVIVFTHDSFLTQYYW